MRVLLVEDERLIRRDVAEALGNAGYLVEEAGDGEEAWFRGETGDYAAIVLDLGLPRLDGISVLERLRATGIDTPVLILTARGSWMERVRGIDAGADDYLPKPFQMEELVSRLGAIVRRRNGHATPILTIGPIRIDTRLMTVTNAGRPLVLSPLEFRLLRFLAHNKGRVVAQGELVEHVYEAEREPGSNAIEVLMTRLRRKLGADVIQTRRGFGYFVEG